ncbi:aminotransferase class V-fold PLP-dependent enzyme [Actinokineospora iranica]|uniref:Isopenicillin-N epimerase n=1 Tax=Actinokineospora iranica TaxID=1271860 RepID=A0A1G6IY62_9PSEU|nr:aminotransferase class V-fold PLP-dependent enzyme [Actinokineospora iranica]SDC11427.1 isopenicillin-N epimerase [Actinokineospora iranica]
MTFHDSRFALDPDVLHMTPGAFGVAPTAVLAARAEYRRRAEANPTRFHRVESPELVERARLAAAAFLGGGSVGDGVALVRNATEGVATVLAATPLAQGDEILLSEHGYGAVRIACQAKADAAGATVRSVDFPVGAEPDAIVRAFADGLRPTTRLVVVDGISSDTALSLPVTGIADVCRAHGAPVLVDGAHVPGQVPVRPDQLGVDFWVGNFHKWAYACRSTAGLWAAPAWRDRLRPLVPSWTYPEGFPHWFGEAGTNDQTAWMALPDAIAFWHEAGGWAAVDRSAALLDKGVRVVAEAIGADGQASAHHAPLMRLVALPAGLVADAADARRYYLELSARGAETSIVWRDGRAYIRLGAAIYQREDDYQALAALLADGR